MENMSKELSAVVSGVRIKHYPKGQIILHQGDTPTETYIVKTGAIKIYDIDEDGNEKILHIVKPYAVIPLAFFSGGLKSTNWFYGSLVDSDVYVVSSEELSRRVKNNGELAVQLMNWFSLEVHELLVRLSSLGKTNTRGKITSALKFLGVHHATSRRSGWRRVDFPVNHQLLADMTGVTRESAAVIMKNLQDEKIIRNPRQTILEIDLDKLIKQPDAG